MNNLIKLIVCGERDQLISWSLNETKYYARFIKDNIFELIPSYKIVDDMILNNYDSDDFYSYISDNDLYINMIDFIRKSEHNFKGKLANYYFSEGITSPHIIFEIKIK